MAKAMSFRSPGFCFSPPLYYDWAKLIRSYATGPSVPCHCALCLHSLRRSAQALHRCDPEPEKGRLPEPRGNAQRPFGRRLVAGGHGCLDARLGQHGFRHQRRHCPGGGLRCHQPSPRSGQACGGNQPPPPRSPPAGVLGPHSSSGLGRSSAWGSPHTWPVFSLACISSGLSAAEWRNIIEF